MGNPITYELKVADLKIGQELFSEHGESMGVIQGIFFPDRFHYHVYTDMARYDSVQYSLDAVHHVYDSRIPESTTYAHFTELQLRMLGLNPCVWGFDDGGNDWCEFVGLTVQDCKNYMEHLNGGPIDWDSLTDIGSVDIPTQQQLDDPEGCWGNSYHILLHSAYPSTGRYEVWVRPFSSSAIILAEDVAVSVGDIAVSVDDIKQHLSVIVPSIVWHGSFGTDSEGKYYFIRPEAAPL